MEEFYEKYEMYRSELGNGELQIRLEKHLQESLDSLYLNIQTNNCNISKIKYLINELLQDKEHLDAFLAANIKRPK